ncbi:MAG: hypothetical protein DRJ65_08810 [Acidobacteria bacterium]|nr:MAG: hypothetical protein DRJ65_08810 [Acidobacteriota bacterium]
MKSIVFPIVVVFLLRLLVPAAAFAQTAAGLDQYQLNSNIGWAFHSTTIGQWFTVGADGLLSAAEFSLYIGGNASEGIVIEIYDFTGGSLGALRGSTSISNSDLGPMETVLDINAVTATLIPLEHLGIVVSNGETMAIRLSTAAVSPDFYGIRGMTSNAYPNGEWFAGNNPPDPGNDLMFKTFVALPVFADDFETGDLGAWD